MLPPPGRADLQGELCRCGLVQALTSTPAVTGPAAVDFAENSDGAVATYGSGPGGQGRQRSAAGMG